MGSICPSWSPRVAFDRQGFPDLETLLSYQRTSTDRDVPRSVKEAEYCRKGDVDKDGMSPTSTEETIIILS